MATIYFTNPKGTDRLAQLWEELLSDAVPLRSEAARERLVVAAVLLKRDEPMRRSWRADLSTLFENVLEPEVLEPPLPCTVEVISKEEAFAEPSIEAAHEAALAMSSPFHWEPKPAWVNVPGPATPAFLKPADPLHFPSGTRIPLRPLHKQPFYRRFYFYLRRWLSRPR